jgi:hypothetical protein
MKFVINSLIRNFRQGDENSSKPFHEVLDQFNHVGIFSDIKGLLDSRSKTSILSSAQQAAGEMASVYNGGVVCG